MKTSTESVGFVAIAVTLILGCTIIFFQNPIPQDIEYHHFADTRSIWDIPNFWNVLSNLAFLIVGLMGLLSMRGAVTIKFHRDIKVAYLFFFLGISLVSLGSGYYHLFPNNDTLVWDRLPMAISFMALLAIITGEFISTRFSKLCLFPLLIIGVFSVMYWHITEAMGAGDLRPYILVQFLPILIIPIILVCFKPSHSLTSGYWLLISWYLVAKVLEHFDSEIYNAVHILSGHALKHLAAALGIFFLLRSYQKRQKT